MPDKHGILPAKYFSSEESVDIVMAEGNLHPLFIGPLQTPIYQTVRARQDGRVAFVRSG
jgi:hypothetical protein